MKTVQKNQHIFSSSPPHCPSLLHRHRPPLLPPSLQRPQQHSSLFPSLSAVFVFLTLLFYGDDGWALTTLFKWRHRGCRYKLRPRRRRREVVENMIYFCYGGGVVSADLQWEKWGCKCVERGQRRSEVRTADGGGGGQRIWMKKLLEMERYTGERGRSSGPSSFF